MRQRGIHLPFECITRADRVDAEVVERMRALGCYRVWLGSESGSQRVLDAMSRGVTVEAVRDATRQFQAAGIQVGMFLMWGYDGETAADIDATIEHVKRTNPDVFLTTVAYPIKGTPYFDAVADRVVSTTDWAVGSDRGYAVAGRPSKRYYALATRRLKAEVALHRLGDGAHRGEDGRGSLKRLWRRLALGGAVAVHRLGMRLVAGEHEVPPQGDARLNAESLPSVAAAPGAGSRPSVDAAPGADSRPSVDAQPGIEALPITAARQPAELGPGADVPPAQARR
jgi:hypothetical protein